MDLIEWSFLPIFWVVTAILSMSLQKHPGLLIAFLLFSTGGQLHAQGSGHTLTFDGISQAINLGNEVANNCRTLELWFQPSSDIGPGITEPIALIARDFNNYDGASTNEFGIYFYPNVWMQAQHAGGITFMRRVNSTLYEAYSGKTEWTAGHWYHVAATIDPLDGMLLYVNGVLQPFNNPSTEPIGTQTGSPTDNVSLARWGNLDIRHFAGEIDEVRIWETARTQTQIRDQMCRKLTGTEPGLRAYYRFDGTGGFLEDAANDFNGIFVVISETERILSGAPLGDMSTQIYVPNWSGQSLSLAVDPDDRFTIDAVQSQARGAHVYYVASQPNSLAGVESTLAEGYYGVFLTEISGSYDALYHYARYPCGTCNMIYGRNDNAVPDWSSLTGDTGDCEQQFFGESTVGYTYRSEYLLGQTTEAFSLGPDTLLCPDDVLTLDATTPDATYLWSDGSTGSTLTVATPGTYWVRIDADGCEQSDTLVVDGRDLPAVDLGGDTVLCEGVVYVLNAGQSGASYLWQDNSSGPQLAVTSSGQYSVTVTNDCGIASDSVTIRLEDCSCGLYIPNVFSPNDDGVNDTFFPVMECPVSDYDLQIFDRWGSLVFSSRVPMAPWDGRYAGEPAIPGVFVYMLQFVDVVGMSRVVSGTVTVVR